MKERIIAIFLLLLAGLTIWAIATELPKKEYAQPASDFTEAVRNGSTTATNGNTSAMPALSEEVIRLHILAASDSEQDQAIKLALRDALLPYLNAATLGADTKEDALARLSAQCPFFTELLNQALAQYNVNYTAAVSVEHIYFPIHIYGSQTYLSEDAIVFPPGYYDSVQVVLGDGNGHNWWCLAYPSLCFIDSAYDYVPKDSDVYKLKISDVKKSVLEELFYGKKSTDFPLLKVEDTPETDTITIYFDSKLWRLLQSLFVKISGK